MLAYNSAFLLSFPLLLMLFHSIYNRMDCWMLLLINLLFFWVIFCHWCHFIVCHCISLVSDALPPNGMATAEEPPPFPIERLLLALFKPSLSTLASLTHLLPNPSLPSSKWPTSPLWTLNLCQINLFFFFITCFIFHLFIISYSGKQLVSTPHAFQSAFMNILLSFKPLHIFLFALLP